MYVLNGSLFDINMAQVVGDVQYPAGWFDDAARRAEVEIEEAIDTTSPSVSTGQIAVRSGAVQDASGNWLVTWIVRDLTAEEIAASSPTVPDYTVAIQSMLDAKATERRYYNILSACTYATSTNEAFKAEALACLSWRDAVWATAYGVLDQVEAGTLAQPTIPQLLAMLPTMAWPA